MDDLKKEGLKYIEKRFKEIEKYNKNRETEISFIVYHETEGGIDMLETLNIISLEESPLLRKRALDLVTNLQDY